MIHNPTIRVMGDSRDLRKEADVLDKTRDSMIAAYNGKTGISRDELIRMLDDETWMTADEAVAKGFADVAAEPLMAAASVRPGVLAMNGTEFDLTGYRNVPEELKKEMEGKNLTKPNETTAPAAPSLTLPQNAPAAPGEGNAAAEEISKAVSAERERMKALDELSVPGAEGLIAKAKYETCASPEQVALEIVRASKKAGLDAFGERKSDADASGVNSLSATNQGAGTDKAGISSEKAKALKGAIEKGREGK